MKKHFLVPFILFIFIVTVLWRGLSLHASEIPSPLLNQSAPHFTLTNLLHPKSITTNKDFLGHITLVNVWATWCSICAAEHSFLMQLAQDKSIFLYGLNYKDNPAHAKKWLANYGNPYRIVAIDPDGSTGIDWGVYGTPETFVLDKNGIIRFKHVGQLTSEVWQQEIAPLIHQINTDPS